MASPRRIGSGVHLSAPPRAGRCCFWTQPVAGGTEPRFFQRTGHTEPIVAFGGSQNKEFDPRTVFADVLLKHYTYDGLGRLVRTQSPYSDPETADIDVAKWSAQRGGAGWVILETQIPRALSTSGVEAESEILLEGIIRARPFANTSGIPGPLPQKMLRREVRSIHMRSIDEYISQLGHRKDVLSQEIWKLLQSSPDLARTPTPPGVPVRKLQGIWQTRLDFARDFGKMPAQGSTELVRDLSSLPDDRHILIMTCDKEYGIFIVAETNKIVGVVKQVLRESM